MKVLTGLLAAISWTALLLVGEAHAAALTIYNVLPDSLSIDLDEGQPAIRIVEREGGYSVDLVFRADYSRVRARIYRSRGGQVDGVQIIDLPLSSTDFSFIGTFIQDNKALVKAIQREYLGQVVHLHLDLASDLSRQQLQSLFQFNLIYGLATATVPCPESPAHPLCGKTLSAIPVYNQFKLLEQPESRGPQSDFAALRIC